MPASVGPVAARYWEGRKPETKRCRFKPGDVALYGQIVPNDPIPVTIQELSWLWGEPGYYVLFPGAKFVTHVFDRRLDPPRKAASELGL